MNSNMNKRASSSQTFDQRTRSRRISAAKIGVLQARGKIRRFVYSNFRKEATAKKLELRQGECNRCGACCELLFKCPFLKKLSEGNFECGIYEKRPNNCRVFPLDKRDLQEVAECSYTFIEKPVSIIGRVNR